MPQIVREADVIVVGAGLSGLQAAVSVHSAGLSCLVLEARDRVGGKTWSVDFGGGVTDLGAAWINSTNQSKMYALAKRFELELMVQNTQGDIVYSDLDGSVHRFGYGGIPDSGREVEKGGVNNMIMVRDLFERLCHKVDLRDPRQSTEALGKDYDAMSMADFVKNEGGGKTAMATVRIWTRAMLGLEPQEVSALYFLMYCKGGGGIMQMRSDRENGGQFLRLANGTQSFSRALSTLLPNNSIILNCSVRSITDTHDAVVVSTAKGSFRSKKVIVSLPSPLYRTIEFNPRLPPNKVKLSGRTNHGHTSKMILAYATPWWRRAGLCGLSQSLNGLSAVTRDVSNDAAGAFALLCFLVGDPGRQWAKLSPTERRESIIKHIADIFGPAVDFPVPEPTQVIDQIWSNETWSQGCPCPAMPPGLISEIGVVVLSERFGNIHFIGTETADIWRGYMEGAVRSGERGGEEVIQALRKTESKL